MADSTLDDVLADLAAEGDDLDALVAGLADDVSGWRTPTPAAGWTVAHQVVHLAWTDEVALLAAADPVAFGARLSALLADGVPPEQVVDREAEQGAAAPAARILARWRTGRAALGDALRALPDGARLPWFGPPMAAASMATARLMETWAHGEVNTSYGPWWITSL